jgi:uncharacterized protein YdhG (YjbR/CyaY superfamily)
MRPARTRCSHANNLPSDNPVSNAIGGIRIGSITAHRTECRLLKGPALPDREHNRIAQMKKENPKDMDEYLAGVPEPARSTLRKIRAMIRTIVPAETTETISYGMPTFKYLGPLVGFAAFSNHCSFFPMNSSLIQAFKDELTNFETSKGTIRFAADKPLPAALLKKLVKARIAENERKKKR